MRRKCQRKSAKATALEVVDYGKSSCPVCLLSRSRRQDASDAKMDAKMPRWTDNNGFSCPRRGEVSY
uniref:Mobile element protein n=1 Tax=Steinernema glaseri TaxID=37863 RepID=A0A1I7YPM2_9BILA